MHAAQLQPNAISSSSCTQGLPAWLRPMSHSLVSSLPTPAHGLLAQRKLMSSGAQHLQASAPKPSALISSKPSARRSKYGQLHEEKPCIYTGWTTQVK
ncbi:unnamed protein product [Prunus brigantina]